MLMEARLLVRVALFFIISGTSPLKTPQTRPLFLCRGQSHRSALARHAGHGLRSLHKEFGTCPSAVHGACRSAVSACAETTSLCPVFLLTLTLRTAFACRAQGCEHAADDVAARTPLPALAVSSTLHLRRFTAGNLRCAADCRRSVLRFAPYRSSIVAASWTVRHSVALLKVSGMAVCSRRHPTASARS